MWLSGNEYDAGVNTFSPAGHLYQVEYACKAVNHGATSLGIQTSEGVVLACEKQVRSPLLVSDAVVKIRPVSDHCALALSGLMSDARSIVTETREIASQHWFEYNESMPVRSVAQAIGDLCLRFGDDDPEKRTARPYGVGMLVGGIDQVTGEPELWYVDPSGVYLKYKAKAIGAAFEGSNTQMESDYYASMTLQEALELAVTVLRGHMEAKMSVSNVDIAVITPEDGFKRYTTEMLADLLESVEDSTERPEDLLQQQDEAEDA